MQLARTALKERIEHLNRLILCSKSSGVNSARNSFIGPHPGRLSTGSIAATPTTSRDSSVPNTVRDSSLTTLSATSLVSAVSSVTSTSSSTDPEIDPTATGFATLSVQFRALQADLAEKNRYISTLEKRLLHARRSSQNRASLGPTNNSSRSGSVDLGPGGVPQPPPSDHRYEILIQEKDQEIAELRARLDDKDRMVAALRSAARKRDAATDVVSRRTPSGYSLTRKGSSGSHMSRSRESLQEIPNDRDPRSPNDRDSCTAPPPLRRRQSSRQESRDSMKGMIPLQLQSAATSPVVGLGVRLERSESESKVRRLERKDSSAAKIGRLSLGGAKGRVTPLPIVATPPPQERKSPVLEETA